VVEGAGRDHELVDAGAADELGERVCDRAGITDHVRLRRLRDHRLLGF
jgi:hypothetical protein